MVKVLRIYGYNAGVAAKYGNQDIVHGIAYVNDYSTTKGYEARTIWLPSGKINWSDDCIGKDLYVEYGYRGRIESCLVK